MKILALCALAAAILGCARSAAPPKTSETPPPPDPVWTDSAHASRAVLLDSGARYFRSCALCHGGDGRGSRGPTVTNADFVQRDRARLIRTVLHGVHDSIRVNGVRWRSGEMVGWAGAFTDFQVAAVLTYIRVALNDSLVVSCIPEDYETGTWASCEKKARSAAEIAADSISVQEVNAVRATLSPGPRR